MVTSALTKMTKRAQLAEDKLKELEGRSNYYLSCTSRVMLISANSSSAAIQKMQDDAAAAAAEREAHASRRIAKDKGRASQRDRHRHRHRRRRGRGGSDDESSQSDAPPPTPAQEYANGVLLALPDWAPIVRNDSIPRPRGRFNLAHEMGFPDATNYYYLRVRVSTSNSFHCFH